MVTARFHYIQTSLRIPVELKDWLEGEAIKEFSSVNRVIWAMIEKERERRQSEDN